MNRRTILACLFVTAAISSWIFLFDNSSSTGTAVLGGYRDRWFLFCLLITYAGLWCWGLAISRPGKAALGRILLIHVGVALSVAILEVPAFLGRVDYRDVLGLQTGHRAVGRRPEDPRLSHIGKPNTRFEGTSLPDLVGVLGAQATPIPVDFQTDDYGLRNKSTKTDPGILFLGDSMLVAGLVPIDSIVSERVERAIGHTVLNVSEVGYSPQEELVRLETVEVPLQGKLVVQFIFEGNDLSDSKTWRARAHRSGASTWPESGLVKALLKSLHRPKRAAGQRRSGRFVTAGGDVQDVYFLYDSKKIDGNIEEFTFIARAMQGFASDIREEGGRYAVVFIPMKLGVLHAFCTWPEGSDLGDPRIARSSMLARLGSACEAEGIPLLDLTPHLEAAASEGRLPYFAADTHLNALGHKIMADAVGPWITTLDQ